MSLSRVLENIQSSERNGEREKQRITFICICGWSVLTPIATVPRLLGDGRQPLCFAAASEGPVEILTSCQPEPLINLFRSARFSL